MLDRYIEKSLLYLVAVSAVLHVAVFAFYWLYAKEPKPAKQDPYFVELEDLPDVKPPKLPSEKDRISDSGSSVKKETAPRGEMRRDIKSVPRTLTQPKVPEKSNNKVVERPLPILGSSGQTVKRVPRTGGGLLKEKKSNLPELARLYPGANRLAALEENYRKKYDTEIAEGEAKFLNTDDIMFGSFLRRFETAVYGVWRYPPDAVRLGIEGVTPVKITFNRKGEVEDIELLESSGSTILDKEVFRTLRLIGPVGAFPKGYDKEKFKLIAFFQYGIIRGVSRGMLH